MTFRISVWMILLKIMLIASTLTFSQFVGASALLSDDFNTLTTEPNPVWRFYDPYDTTSSNDAGEATRTFDGTNALISIPEGLAHDLWKTVDSNKAPRLLQAASNTDFKFEVKFETAPKVKHQLQGIIVQQSDNVFLRFDVFFNVSGVHLFIAYVDGAMGTVITHKSIALPNSPNYRQVIRSGDNWTFRYSNDGTTWTDAATFTQSLTVSEVGFFAGTVGINPKFLSSVDYFVDLDEPIIDNDTWTPPASAKVPSPIISTWYGYNPPSGQPGISQKWVNILGNVYTDVYISTLAYKINGSSEQFLNFGSDTRRLQETGDFNIEIDPASLNVGFNQIEIKAKDSNDQISTKVVTINYAPGNFWPLPYTADWGSLTNIQSVEGIAHIVDGLWKSTPNGIRTVQPGYDRSIAIGDKAWSSDYEVTVPITFHSDFSGMGFAVGWQGHEGGRSPKIEWPLQALAWIRGPVANPKLEIITYGGLPTTTWEHKETPDPQHSVSITKDVTYMLKSSSSKLANGMSRFSVKFWRKNEAEPVAWNVNADVPTRDGSVLLIANYGDVTFGNVFVEAQLSSLPPGTTLPVISNIQVAATDTTAIITWNTDKPSNSVVNYGLNSDYGLNSNNADQTTTHSLSLTGLNSNTAYHYQTKSADSDNKTGISGDLVFTTKAIEPPPVPPIDNTPPIISNIQAEITNSLAIVTWDTDEPSTSEINYGLSSNYGANVSDATLTTKHSISLTLANSNSDIDYFYQIKSVDSNNNVASISGIYKLIANKGISKEAKECLFNWAEQQYPLIFSPTSVSSQQFEDYTYRYYSDTNIYLGFFQNKKVHYLEANKSDGIVDAGDVKPYQDLAGCL